MSQSLTKDKFLSHYFLNYLLYLINEYRKAARYNFRK